ncbi:unnamed protein product, partial [Medioppia subpectinata]
ISGMYVEIGSYPNITAEDCGLRYVTKKHEINYIPKCFANHVQNQTIDDIFGSFEAKSAQTVATNRIYGGRDVEYAESPSTVLIKYDSPTDNHYYTCTGSLINERWVVTAAHCNFNFTTKANIFSRIHVFVGNNYHRESGLTISVNESRMFRHQMWASGVRRYDIALYMLNRAVDLKRTNSIHFLANTICLPKQRDHHWGLNEELESATIYGWGVKYWTPDRYVPAEHLQMGAVVLQNDPNMCEWLLCSRIDYAPPAVQPSLSRTCPGDSGGPLIQYTDAQGSRGVLIGITNIDTEEGILCSEHNYKLFWTPVAIHVDWIINSIKTYRVLDSLNVTIG